MVFADVVNWVLLRWNPKEPLPGLLLGDPLRLAALISACSLCDVALPEREGHPGLFHGLLALLDMLEGEAWAPAYIMWEIAFMGELGFGLDLSKCAGGGDRRRLLISARRQAGR